MTAWINCGMPIWPGPKERIDRKEGEKNGSPTISPQGNKRPPGLAGEGPEKKGENYPYSRKDCSWGEPGEKKKCKNDRGLVMKKNAGEKIPRSQSAYLRKTGPMAEPHSLQQTKVKEKKEGTRK